MSISSLPPTIAGRAGPDRSVARRHGRTRATGAGRQRLPVPGGGPPSPAVPRAGAGTARRRTLREADSPRAGWRTHGAQRGRRTRRRRRRRRACAERTESSVFWTSFFKTCRFQSVQIFVRVRSRSDFRSDFWLKNRNDRDQRNRRISPEGRGLRAERREERCRRRSEVSEPKGEIREQELRTKNRMS